jgi:predicted nucleic acid-binding protein
VQLEERFAGRILFIDPATAKTWGEVDAKRRRSGRPLPVVDGLLAATALRHGAVLATRNTGDFRDSGVQLVNPWAHGTGVRGGGGRGPTSH